MIRRYTVRGTFNPLAKSSLDTLSHNLFVFLYRSLQMPDYWPVTVILTTISMNLKTDVIPLITVISEWFRFEVYWNYRAIAVPIGLLRISWPPSFPIYYMWYRRIVRWHGKRTEKTYILGRSTGNIFSQVKTLTIWLVVFSLPRI